MIRTKKFFAAFAACLMMLFPLSITVFADLNDSSLPRVVDEAELLDEGQISSLENRISDISEKYDFDIVILTTYSIGGSTAQGYADDYYDYNGYGAGKKNDGILLLVSMEDHDWAISATGYGKKVFPNEKCQEIGSDISEYLHNGNYSSAFSEFLSETESSLSGYKPKMILISVAIGLGIGLAAAIIVVLVLMGQLKSVGFQRSASDYEVPGSMNVTRSHDMFLYRQVSKTRKADSDSGSHSGSSGTSHTGASGKF